MSPTALRTAAAGAIELRREIPIAPDAPARARELLGGLGDFADHSLRFHAQLLVSELISHRVRDAAVGPPDTLGLHMSLSGERLRVHVSDRADRPVLGSFRADEPALGWELQIVADLADRWGIRQDADTTSLWFELDVLD
jgi:hypothetical protein